MKKVAIISDTHGHLDERIQGVIRDCDLALHAGDILGKRVLDAMRPRSGTVHAVRGNNDIPAQWEASEHALLHSLPHESRINLPGGDILLVHGDQHWNKQLHHSKLRACFPDCRAIVYGHSHYVVCDTGHTPWVLNPGAAGRTRTHGGPSCLILTASIDQWHIETLRFSET